MMHLGVKKGWDRPKITWKEGFSKDLKTHGIIADLAKDSAQWSKKIHIGDLY